jgi:murein DD-endopeptidase MepM/ murein hydrolase activator NlpD
MLMMFAGRAGRARRSAGCAVVVGVAITALAGPAGSAGGAAPATDDRRAELEAKLGEAQAAETAAQQRLDSVLARQHELEAGLATLDARVAAAQVRLATARRAVDDAVATVQALGRRVRLATERLEIAHDEFRDAVSALYRGESAEAAATASLFFAADDPHEFFAGNVYLEHVSEDRWSTVDVLDGLRDAVTSLREEAEARAADLEQARETAERERDDLARLRAEQAARRDAAAAEAQLALRIISSIRDDKARLSAELAALQQTSSGIAELLYARQKGQTRADDLHLARPVPGPVVSSFGPRFHPILHTTRLHAGADLDAATGDPIRAAAGGVVAWAGWRGGYGYCVILDHGNQYATLYAHASELYVGAGERVATGEVVAAAGSTGLATGPHLHFELRLLGSPVDPVPYL